MIKFTGTLLVALAALGLAVPASLSAAPPTGSRIERKSTVMDGRYNPRSATSPRAAIRAYTVCLASLNRVRAANAADAPYGTKEQGDLVRIIIRERPMSLQREEDCFSDFGAFKMRIDPVAAAGSFSEYLILENYDSDDVAQIAQLSADDWQTPGLTPRNGNEMISLCVAQARADLVMDLVQTEPAGGEEMSAIQALVPYLGPCLTEGVEVSFDAASIRAMLAHGLYLSLSQMEELKKVSS